MNRRLKGALWFFSVMGYLALCWTVSYWATRWVYRLVGWEPAELFRHLVTGGGGFFMWGVTMVLVGRMMQGRRKDFFTQLLDAVRRIAKGDFNVSIPVGDINNTGVFTELVESFNHMAGELGQMEKLRQEFISNVSHEFRSPLASIGGFARALRQEGLDESERRRYLEIIETECKRLSRLSDNLMKLTSLESEHQPFEKRSYRLDKQLRDAVLLLEPLWSEKELELEADLAELTVRADEELMGQVWLNLIHNAVKFTPERGTVAVRLGRDSADGAAVAVVEDTGIGMSPEEQAHMFERFWKADVSRNRGQGGSGLGLSIVRKIVEKHGGVIRVASNPGTGTRIEVRLPVE